MKNIPELIFKSHQEAKSIWNNNQNLAMEELCHSLLEQQLQYISPTDPRMQKMLIDNCEILKFRGDFNAIASLLQLLNLFLPKSEPNRNDLDHLYNRIRLMIRPQAA